ncbi:MFS transporter [Chamaesiphon sp. OTE_75_metabat_556]|uniref:MFS transporter n=1 Tax=Chamaesiphon sp. OTE_75_metabat_556 TaxID=2964692 RepID=UPI00286A4164|nr:MFS transporter [Chamaesiphon sp. OTE_75_metabat_556]
MNSTDQHVLWRQVWGVAALLSAIVLSWMAYGFYQPVILHKLGFDRLAESLGIIQGFLGAAIEPLAGVMSDRVLRRTGSRLPAIAVGVTLAGLLFVTIGLLLHGNLSPELYWIIPVLMTFWVISMIIFRGPVISLLRQFAPTASLPAANSIVTLILGLIGAIGPLFSRVIELLGAANTFLFGAVMLTIGALLFWSNFPQVMVKIEPNLPATNILAAALSEVPRQSLDLQFRQWLQNFVVGFGSGLVTNILLRVCPQQLPKYLFNIPPEQIAAAMLFVCAIAAIPLERKVKKWGLNRSMTVGISSLAIAIVISSISHLTIVSFLVVILGGVALSVLFVTQIPWCLGRLPYRQTGLSTGLYFGGMGAASALLGLTMRSIF